LTAKARQDIINSQCKQILKRKIHRRFSGNKQNNSTLPMMDTLVPQKAKSRKQKAATAKLEEI